MKKWKKHTLMHYIMCSAMLIGSIVFANDAAVFAQERTVTAMPMDQVILPDLYNTGPQVSSEDMVKTTGGILPCVHDGNKETMEMLVDTSTLKFNFGYKHKDVKGTLVFDNLDLSQYELSILGADQLAKTGRSVKLIFNNCTFRKVSTGRTGDEGLALEFNNCTFVSAVGSNLTFNHCRFGGGINDRMNLFVDCFVNDSYIYNPSSDLAAEGEIHVDGVQIFGDQAATSRNIHYNNCRFEVPSVTYPNAPLTYVNACIMVQLEYSKGENMSFTNCYLNGGGYSLYAHSAPGAHDIQGQQITDIRFKDLHFGCAGQFGWLYPKNPEIDEVEWNKDTWNEANSIYVGTVTRDQNKNQTYLSVSNDTNQNRYFRAYTSSGKYYDYMIDACPTYKEFKDQNIPFENFPFDRQYVIPEYCDWVAVFEIQPQKNTVTAQMKQVRFQNWTNNKTVKIADVSAETMKYSLENGVLKISGIGDMPDFDEDQIPWKGQEASVRKVVFESDAVSGRGMDSIAANAFANCTNLEEVVLPKNMKVIGANAFLNCEKLSTINLGELSQLNRIGEKAFANCVSLKSVHFGNLLKNVEKDAFAVDLKVYPDFKEPRDIYYEGPLSRWMSITFGTPGTTGCAAANPMYVTGGNLYVENSKLVTELNTAELNVQSVNAALFAGCKSLKKIDLEGVKLIGESAFDGSAVGGLVVIPETVKTLGMRAFNGCEEITKLVYKGSSNIPNGCFTNNIKLEEVEITQPIESLKNMSFYGCTSLKNIKLPDSINEIGQSSFQNCASLETIVISAGVKEIKNYTFDGCSSLEKIIFQGESCPTINKNSFKGVNEAGVTVCIPENATGYTENEFLTKICKEVETYKPEPATNEASTEATTGGNKPSSGASTEVTTEIKNLSSDATTENNTKGETVADNNKSDTDAWKVVVDKNLKGTSFKKYINKKSRKLYLSWKKRSNVTGYEIQYSTSKKFKSGTKKKIITKATKTSVTFKKLKKSKRYYVRIRTYKNGNGVKYVSKWSKKKTVTIKK